RLHVPRRERRAHLRRQTGAHHRPRARHAARARRQARRDGAAPGAPRPRHRGERTRGRRADQSSAAQDRKKSDQPRLFANGGWRRLSPGGDRMTTIEASLAGIRSVFGRVMDLWDRFGGWVNAQMPKGLYARSLLIIVTPMVLLQSVVAFVFMERHFNLVTQRLSASVVQDVAALIDMHEALPPPERSRIQRIARERLKLQVDFMPVTD